MQQKFIHCLRSHGSSWQERQQHTLPCSYTVHSTFQRTLFQTHGVVSLHEKCQLVYSQRLPLIHKKVTPVDKTQLQLRSRDTQGQAIVPPPKSTYLPCKWNVKTYLCFLTLPSLSGHCGLMEPAGLHIFPHSLTSICSMGWTKSYQICSNSVSGTFRNQSPI